MDLPRTAPGATAHGPKLIRLRPEKVSKIAMKPPHPGNFIRTEIPDELGLSVARAAEIFGVRRATLSDPVNGKASLSAEMALRIEKAFDVSMDTLLWMQAWYDSYTCARWSILSLHQATTAKHAGLASL